MGDGRESFCYGPSVQSPSRRPSFTGSMKRAVAQVSTRGAHPGVCYRQHLFNIFSIPHEQAVPTEHTLQGVTFTAGRPFTQRFLSTLMTCQAVDLVVYPVALSIVPILEKFPGGIVLPQRLHMLYPIFLLNLLPSTVLFIF